MPLYAGGIDGKSLVDATRFIFQRGRTYVTRRVLVGQVGRKSKRMCPGDPVGETIPFFNAARRPNKSGADDVYDCLPFGGSPRDAYPWCWI